MKPGRIPNREADLARPRSRKGSDQVEVTRGELMPVTIPEPDPSWHPIALLVWDGLITSGQSQFYQNSDWAFAYSVCEDLSMYKRPHLDRSGNEYVKRSGQMLQTIYSALERLLITEGDRRRVRLELTTPEPDEDAATVTVMADYKAGLGLAPNPD